MEATLQKGQKHPNELLWGPKIRETFHAWISRFRWTGNFCEMISLEFPILAFIISYLQTFYQVQSWISNLTVCLFLLDECTINIGLYCVYRCLSHQESWAGGLSNPILRITYMCSSLILLKLHCKTGISSFLVKWEKTIGLPAPLVKWVWATSLGQE